MRTKKVNRYYCDFCKKSGGSAGHMRRHEDRCTMNPDRYCGVCESIASRDNEEHTQAAMTDLIAALPVEGDVDVEDMYEAVADAMPSLIELAGNCPACILAAIRQAKWVGVAEYDYKAETQSLWAAINDAEARDCQHG